jgi:hypothetical protein
MEAIVLIRVGPAHHGVHQSHAINTAVIAKHGQALNRLVPALCLIVIIDNPLKL